MTPHPSVGPVADVWGQLGKRDPLESSGLVPLFRTGHPGLAEDWWLDSSLLAKQLKENGSKKEGETERGRERERKSCSGDAADASWNLHLVKMII